MTFDFRTSQTSTLSGVLTLLLSIVFVTIPFNTAPANATTLIETQSMGNTHSGGNLPPVSERVPAEPLVIDLESKNREPGRHGGELQTLIGRAKDVRLINVWGYARLVGYNANYELVSDILRDVEIEEGRIFTLHLREGHKWSDGNPFTTEDFRYFWEDIANNEELSPTGPPDFMLVDGTTPEFEVIDATTVRFSWKKQNPLFLSTLAAARPPFIYRPAHFLKRYHEKYGNPEEIAEWVEERKVRSWAPLHNGIDRMYNATDHDLPTLQPWMPREGNSKQRAVMIRNPYYHRIDSNGRQLPYIDQIVMSVSDSRLVPTKTQAGESQLQARNLSFSDMTVLKRGEELHSYKTVMWPISKGSAITLFPNLTTTDPVWRKLLRDERFRHALSLGIDRKMISRVLYFGLASESNNTVLPQSPLFKDDYRTLWTQYDPDKANELLDEIGLMERRGDGIRLLPDGRPLELIVESVGESSNEIDVLELVGETWREIGVSLFPKASQRDVVRDRALSGNLVMSVWAGFNNGIPTPEMPPTELAPMLSSMLNYAAWGAYQETGGQTGEEIDYPPAQELVELFNQWKTATTKSEREEIWHEMLKLRAEQTFDIGIISSDRQPVVIHNSLRNVPEEGIYGWDPGAQFGIHRMDEFWIDENVVESSSSGGRG